MSSCVFLSGPARRRDLYFHIFFFYCRVYWPLRHRTQVVVARPWSWPAHMQLASPNLNLKLANWYPKLAKSLLRVIQRIFYLKFVNRTRNDNLLTLGISLLLFANNLKTFGYNLLMLIVWEPTSRTWSSRARPVGQSGAIRTNWLRRIMNNLWQLLHLGSTFWIYIRKAVVHTINF